MMREERTQTDLGTVKIHKNVIASIAAMAAGEIGGVKKIGRDFTMGVLELMGKKSLSSIRVTLDKNEEVKIEIPLIIKFGFNIPEVAARVQENVRAALEKMTNLTLKDVDINVQGIERG